MSGAVCFQINVPFDLLITTLNAKDNVAGDKTSVDNDKTTWSSVNFKAGLININMISADKYARLLGSG